jgi:hypothetical protein
MRALTHYGRRVSKTDEIRAEIKAARQRPGSILAIDPDAHTPGAALWSPPSEAHEDGRCWVWGGNRTGEALACPTRSEDVLRALMPSLVLIEAQKSGRDTSHQMAAQNIVRGGWAWLCAISYVPYVMVPPKIWQGAICGWGLRGKGAYKIAYKARASKRAGRAMNEDAAAALGILEFGLGALGHDLPDTIQLACPQHLV